jgi:hypothetical protein
MVLPVSALAIALSPASILLAQTASLLAHSETEALESVSLPEAPQPVGQPEVATAANPPCPAPAVQSGTAPASIGQPPKPCPRRPNFFKRFLDSPAPVPLTPKEKAELAIHNMTYWGNLLTIMGTAAFTVATDSHSPYGPGFKGLGRDTGYSLLQDTTGEFFGTFLVPALTGQDPRYHRMPHASIRRRLVHVVSWTIIAQSDDGRPMPNYSSLLTNPICAEISNLYVPGLNTNGPSTAERIALGYATEPIDILITEFLPDVASHIHVHDIFVQRIINKVASGQITP